MTAEFALNRYILENDIILFLGAGASAPLGKLPTRPFLELLGRALPERINKSEGNSPRAGHFMQLFSQAAAHHGVAQADSEILLDHFDCIVQMCSDLDGLPGKFAQLARVSGMRPHQQWANMFSDIKRYVQELIVEHYSLVDGEKASLLYGPLLGSLVAHQSGLTVFTTNYDWAFEYLVETRREPIPLGGWLWARAEGATIGPQGVL